jgi:hypothetical protein
MAIIGRAKMSAIAVAISAVLGAWTLLMMSTQKGPTVIKEKGPTHGKKSNRRRNQEGVWAPA